LSRLKEYAKLGIRDVLHRRNLDLVTNPFPVRVATTARWLELDTVLDIGANIGQYGSALRASGYRAAIVSCEPLPDAFAVLARRSAHDRRWTAVNTAVGSEPGTVQINVSANSFSSSILPMAEAHLSAAPGSEFVATVSVPLTTVAELVSQQRVDPARTLLKVDTQGYETPVLDGAGDLLEHFAAVQLELSYVPLYEGQTLADALIERLVAAGFGLHALDAGFGDRRTGRMLQADGLFVRESLIDSATR
jgi:FkbM family methyltransferase